MNYVVVIWRLDMTSDLTLTYRDELIGPLRPRGAAEKKADQVRRALAKRDLEGEWGVAVSACYPSSYPARDMAETLGLSA